MAVESTWKGVRLSKMSRSELIDALETMSQMYEDELQVTEKYRIMATGIGTAI